MIIVHGPGIVIFCPGTGIVPLGHCVALFHFLIKLYLTNYPAGEGQRYLHLIALTSKYWKG
jgi:hypothetical protein